MTRILGKDAPLEESIEQMGRGLAELGFDLEELDWLNPVPNVWSVKLRDRHCPLFTTKGKGTSPEAAKASALGEFLERLSTNYFFSDYFLGSEIASAKFVHYPNERWFPATASGWPLGVLDEHSRNHFDPQDEICGDQLIDLNSGNDKRGVCCLPFERQRDAETIWFPVNVIGNLFVRNGMAAGNNRYEARVQALAEIFQRHIKHTIISTGISLPRVPAKVISKYPRIEAAIKALRVQGFLVDVRDASLGGKFPLVNISLFNKEDGGCISAFGAHPKFEVAFERALTELLQGRALEGLKSLPQPTFDLDQTADLRNLEAHFFDSNGMVAWDLFSDDADYEFTEWNIAGDSEAEFNELCRRIHAVDLEIYIADYDHLGICCCRVLVPGMSEIYPVDKLVWRNNNAAAPLRSAIFAADRLEADEAADLLEEIEQAGFDDAQCLVELLGLLPDPGSRWEQISIAELKMLLALRSGDLALAENLCGWLVSTVPLSLEMQKLYRCLHQVLAIAVSTERAQQDYQRLFESLYGETVYQHCLLMLQGEQLFDGLCGYDETLAEFKQHQAMLSVYQRLQKAKARCA